MAWARRARRGMGNEDGQETPEVVIGTEILLAPTRAKKAIARQWASARCQVLRAPARRVSWVVWVSDLGTGPSKQVLQHLPPAEAVRRSMYPIPACGLSIGARALALASRPLEAFNAMVHTDYNIICHVLCRNSRD